MQRSILFLLALSCSVLLVGGASPASAQSDADLANCKNPHIENLKGVRFPVKNEQGVEEMRLILTGAPDGTPSERLLQPELVIRGSSAPG